LPSFCSIFSRLRPSSVCGGRIRRRRARIELGAIRFCRRGRLLSRVSWSGCCSSTKPSAASPDCVLWRWGVRLSISGAATLRRGFAKLEALITQGVDTLDGQAAGD
jgi:hypothetical protein